MRTVARTRGAASSFSPAPARTSFPIGPATKHAAGPITSDLLDVDGEVVEVAVLGVDGHRVRACGRCDPGVLNLRAMPRSRARSRRARRTPRRLRSSMGSATYVAWTALQGLQALGANVLFDRHVDAELQLGDRDHGYRRLVGQPVDREKGARARRR